MTASKVVPVSIALAADHHRDVDPLAGHLCEPGLQRRPLRRAGCVAPDGLVDRRRRPEDAGSAHEVDCIVGFVRVTRHVYEVPGWGVGELWLRDGVVVQHELPSEALRAQAERETGAGADVSWRARPVRPRDGRERAEHGAPLHAGDSRLPPMGERRSQHERYRPNPSRDRAAFVPDLCRRFERTSRATQTSYDDVPLDFGWATPLQRSLAAAARAFPGARSSPTASWQRSRAGRRRPRRGVVLRRQPLRAHHPVPPHRRGERDRRVRQRRPRAQAPARSRSKAWQL